MTNEQSPVLLPVQEASKELALPSAPYTGQLAVIAKDSSPKELSCSALLKGDTRALAEQDAAKLLPQMLDNPQIRMNYGADALKDVNALVDRLLHEMEPVKVPELTQLMQDLNDDMRSIQKDYDVSNPKVREKFEKWKGGVKRFLGQAKTMLEMLMEDVSSLEKQVQKVEENLTGKQLTLDKNVIYYKELYKQNEEAIKKLIYVIGVMELIRDLAAKQAATIQVGDANLGDRGAEQQAVLTDFVSAMDVKIGDYKGRLWVAWFTSPQVRMMISMNEGLSGKISTMVQTTIPTMRMTIVTWRGLMQSKEAGEAAAVVRDASNEWLQNFAKAAAVTVPAIAKEVQEPTVYAETVSVMAQSIADQATGIIEALDYGQQKRSELEAQMVVSKQVLDDSATRVSDKLLEQVVARAKQLDIETSVS